MLQVTVCHQPILTTTMVCVQTGSPKKQPKDDDVHELEDVVINKPSIQQQPQTIGYKDIQHLAFGFRHIVEIDHLHGLFNLKKLQLDNNCLTKIENLDHLVCHFCHFSLARQAVHTLMPVGLLAGQLNLVGLVLQQHQQAGMPQQAD